MAEKKNLGLRQIASSVGSAFLGVQSSRNRERDFEHGRPRDFIIMGLAFTALFIMLVWGLVQLVMHVAT